MLIRILIQEACDTMTETMGASRVDEIRRRIAAVPAEDWVRCPGCAAALYRPRLRQHSWTCPECGHHCALSAMERITMLTDAGTFAERDAGLVAVDPLEFRDSQPYPERLAAAARRTGLTDAVRYGTATIGGYPAVLAVMDFGFMGGSMGSVVGEKVCRAAELALATATPLIVCSSSGGARMQEGIFSLLQMGKTAAAVRRLADAGIPYLSVLCDPTYGGVSASFAHLGDVVLAEPGARAGFAGQKVIEQTIRQQLPAGFQTAEFMVDNGHIDAVVPRAELAGVIARFLRFHAGTGWAAAAGAGTAAPRPGASPTPGATTTRDAWQTVQLARNPGRPHLGEYLELIFDDFLELRGDRWCEDDPSITGGLALLDGTPVVVAGHRKGRGTAEGVARNFGMPHPSGYRKANRLMRHAERFGLPVITFVDTPGAYPGIRAEQENQSRAIAENLALLSVLRVPVISVVIGEGGSGGALALGIGDRLLMLEHTTYSVISPEGCATILFRDAGRAPEAARALRLTARDLLDYGVIDEVVAEPDGGAHTDHDGTAGRVKDAVRRHLEALRAVPAADLIAARYRRLRATGAWLEAARS
jgi:acetyl-CoA carboxylase carboxyl transferase subunit beta